MHDDVARRLQEDVPPGSITALAGAGSAVLTISAQSPSPETAQHIARSPPTRQAGRSPSSSAARPLLSTVQPFGS
jgi:hypothetical protein